MSAAEILFLIFAAGTCGGALAVVFSQNVARMAFWLIVALGSTAGLFFLLRADFVGATQLLVYVGGTLVLVVFGVMLTAQGPFITMKTGAAEWAVAMVVGLLLYGVLAMSILMGHAGPIPETERTLITGDPAASVFLVLFMRTAFAARGVFGKDYVSCLSMR